MKIVLTQEVRGLGSPGDVVEVADGYARNYLIPRKVAMRADAGALKQVQRMRRFREVAEVRDLEQARDIALQLEALKVTIAAKAGDQGRLFGQVTPAVVAEAIAKAGGPRIDRKRLHIEAPIKSLGAHTVHLRLHPDVEAAIAVEIVKS